MQLLGTKRCISGAPTLFRIRILWRWVWRVYIEFPAESHRGQDPPMDLLRQRAQEEQLQDVLQTICHSQLGVPVILLNGGHCRVREEAGCAFRLVPKNLHLLDRLLCAFLHLCVHQLLCELLACQYHHRSRPGWACGTHCSLFTAIEQIWNGWHPHVRIPAWQFLHRWIAR